MKTEPFDPAAYDALIFDFDGTLVDSMPAHYVAWCATVAEFDLPNFPEETFYAWGGLPTWHVADRLITAAKRPDLNADHLEKFKENEFRKNTERVEPISQTVSVAREWAGRKPMAVATGAIREICAPILDRLELTALFGAVVTADDVQQPKPAPETFLRAAAQLNISPRQCLAYEDTEPGLASARAAGMDVIDVRRLRTASV